MVQMALVLVHPSRHDAAMGRSTLFGLVSKCHVMSVLDATGKLPQLPHTIRRRTTSAGVSLRDDNQLCWYWYVWDRLLWLVVLSPCSGFVSTDPEDRDIG